MSLIINEEYSCLSNFVNQYTRSNYSLSQKDFFEKQKRFLASYKKKIKHIYDRNLLCNIELNSIIFERIIIFDSTKYGSKTLENFYDSIDQLFLVYPKIRIGIDYEYTREIKEINQKGFCILKNLILRNS